MATGIRQMALLRISLGLLIVWLFPPTTLAEPDFSFSTAKKHLERSIYRSSEERKSFYCGCNYSQEKQVDSTTCGYTPRKSAKRGKRIEWEHVVPASRFGSWRTCWTDGDPECVTSKGKTYKGRRCCRKVDPQFKMMEADLHNLVPAVGELNGDRSNYRITELPGEPRAYGACDFEIDFAKDLMEPAEAIRGDIARAYFYMRSTYGMNLRDPEIQMFEKWHVADPISAWELERDRRIVEIQGTTNPFVASGF